jgi:dipeptidyl aminopeptidase/acylaminoacyl peptidase
MKRRRKIVTGMFFAVVCAIVVSMRPPSFVQADEAKPAAKREPWKPEDEIFQEYAGQLRISPDAKWLVWVKSTADKEKDARVSNLVLSSLTDNKEIELTRGNDNNFGARWSPDGERIAFASSRARQPAKPDTAPLQIWLINPHGGEPWVLTELARAPRQIDWLDKDTITYSAEEDPALYEQELKKKKDDSEIVDDADHAAPVRLYKISVKDKKITRLSRPPVWF